MGTSKRAAFLVFGLIAFNLALISTADAKCTRLAFSVNDYGKIGPTADAKRLLDKYIAKWTAKRSIRGYRTGPKLVKCELFLDFGFFDEHTCRAEATVCWGDAPAKPQLRPSLSTEPDAAPDATPQSARVNTAPVQVKATKPAPLVGAPAVPQVGAPAVAPGGAPVAPQVGGAKATDDGYNQVYESR